jgi:uncharacterized protein
LQSIVVFAKSPTPGTVKTRLSPFLTSREAAELYRAFVQDTLNTARSVANTQTSVAYSPADAEPVLREIIGSPTVSWFAQSGESLGDRLLRAFRNTLVNDTMGVVTVGSDCPALPQHIFEQAFDGLREHDVVLGPATDGGYYLIGLKNQRTHNDRYIDLFRDISWSTDLVYPQTIRAATTAGLSLLELPEWSDVDQAKDLLNLRQTIASIRDAGDRYTGANSEVILMSMSERLDRLQDEA